MSLPFPTLFSCFFLATTALAPAQSTPANPPTAIRIATGSGIHALPAPKGPMFDITAFGAVSNGSALANQKAINAAIDAAAKAGGGTVVIPAGTFKTYSIRLRSNVGIHFASKDSILRAAVQGTGEHQDGGFYDAPEENLFAGLEDSGHAHWANSLIYGIGVHNVMISGPGLIDGSYIDSSGFTVNVLSGGDPREVTLRTASGVPGGANKAVALKDAGNIAFRDFRIRNGGHFAILGTAVDRWTVDNIIVDTNRDAFDIDTCQNLTVRNSVFNSLNDDALVLKGSFGIGKYLTSKNILFEHDTVSGYDAGSVLDQVYSTNKLVASDRDGPTGRVKFGTEGTSGLDTVTIRDMIFDRSRGFALESVDGAELANILFTDVHMKHISSSPIFIVLGDRGRAPVTGISSSEEVSPSNNVRLNDAGWILPNIVGVYGSYPPVRYIPSYDKSSPVPVGGASHPFTIVNQAAPTKLNPASIKPTDPRYANAVGQGFAKIHNIVIRNVTVEDADPRYPIIINGLVDHPIENVSLSHINVEYRGGLTMQDAVDQRQINQSYSYTAYQAAPATQQLSWLVNTFFSKYEALLPRIGWDPAANNGAGAWANDPYNVPEMPREYPEPSMLGILPAYGIYARHVNALALSGVAVNYRAVDARPAIVLDDVSHSKFIALDVKSAPGTPAIVEVTNNQKREPDEEFVKDATYKSTTVTDVLIPLALRVEKVTVVRPASGTPPDSLYAYPTSPSDSHPYSYSIPDDKYSPPLSVYRPVFEYIPAKTISPGTALAFSVVAHTPVAVASLAYKAEHLPAGATFDPATRTFSWTPTPRQIGPHTVTFIVDDGVLPEAASVTINVAQR